MLMLNNDEVYSLSLMLSLSSVCSGRTCVCLCNVVIFAHTADTEVTSNSS